jgi:chromosome partitioning protein
MANIIAVMNHKGGVGKTTTTLNLASCFAACGFRVLIIDMDPQGNAATGLGIDLKSITKGTHDFILGDCSLDEGVVETNIPNVSLLGATFQLAALSTVSSDDEDPEFWLRESLKNDPHSFDYILLDCPPSFGMLSLNALIASQKVIIPVQNESFAISGLQQMEKSIHDIRIEADHPLEFRILMTLSDQTQKLHQLVDQEIRDHFKDQVFNGYIPTETKIAESAFLGRPVLIHAPNCLGARAYQKACIQCLTWCEKEIHSEHEYQQRINAGIQEWRRDKKIITAHEPMHLEDSPAYETQTASAPQGQTAGELRMTIRNGVLLALALTAGMALALLGL